MKKFIISASALILLLAPTAVLADSNSNSNDDTKSSQTSCEDRQQSLDKKADKALDRSEKRLNGLNIVFSGIQTYAQSGDVNIENYDALSANAIARQTTATDAIENIQAPKINCDDKNDKEDTKNLNQNIKDAQKALSAYRKEVMKLFEVSFDS